MTLPLGFHASSSQTDYRLMPFPAPGSVHERLHRLVRRLDRQIRAHHAASGRSVRPYFGVRECRSGDRLVLTLDRHPRYDTDDQCRVVLIGRLAPGARTATANWMCREFEAHAAHDAQREELLSTERAGYRSELLARGLHLAGALVAGILGAMAEDAAVIAAGALAVTVATWRFGTALAAETRPDQSYDFQGANHAETREASQWMKMVSEISNA